MITYAFRLLTLLSLTLVGLSSCSYLSSGSSSKSNQALAYYVPDQRPEFVVKKMIKVKGDMTVIINLLSELLTSRSGENVNIVRNSLSTADFGGKRTLMKIITSPVKVDSLEQFKENFYLGYYILEDPMYVIKPENMSYTVEAQISLRGQDFYVDFVVDGIADWEVYEFKKNGKLKKMPESFKPKIGVGVFKAKRELMKKSRLGNDVVEYESYNVDVKDQPITRGTIGETLVNLIMEKFAINNINAQTVQQ